MGKLLGFIGVTGVAIVITALVTANRINERRAAQLAEREAAWRTEREALETALEEARARRRKAAFPVAPGVETLVAKASATEVIAHLVGLKTAPPGDPRTIRRAIYWFEELIGMGPAGLPAIREFLRRGEDFNFSSAIQARGGRNANDTLVPISLRIGLFDAVKQIGGAEAEEVLTEVLGTTGRGTEVAWLARALQEIAPNKYSEAALAAARELLGRVTERDEREQLFSVLMMYGDTSYVTTAQAQVVHPNGDVDRSALKYLQQSLGARAVPIAAQFYDDTRIIDPANREPFARLALSYVGADAQANEFYQRAINDMSLSRSHRKNLIEDLNEDGLEFRNLTTRDLPMIENRIQLIEQLAPHATDAVNAAAFKEAYKDLINMRERASQKPAQ